MKGNIRRPLVTGSFEYYMLCLTCCMFFVFDAKYLFCFLLLALENFLQQNLSSVIQKNLEFKRLDMNIALDPILEL